MVRVDWVSGSVQEGILKMLSHSIGQLMRIAIETKDDLMEQESSNDDDDSDVEKPATVSHLFYIVFR